MSSKDAGAMSEENGEKPALVPRLRFLEFLDAGEWATPKLEDISVPVEERVGDRKLIPVSISAGIGFVPQAEKFGRNISGNQYRLYTVVRDGDFVYNKGNSLKFPQGCVYDLQGWGEVAAPNVFICFRLKAGYENGFFRQCFEQNAHGLQLRKHITSGARSNGLLNISKDAFFGVKIPTPRHAEQQKIADCLSSLDELITAETQKLDALKTHKKGLMQQLFPREGETVPRLRFPEFREAGEWENLCLENISNGISSGKDKSDPDGLYDLHGSTGVIGKTSTASYRGEFLLVARVGANAGLLTKSVGQFGVTDNALVIQLNESVNLNFVFYYLDDLGLNKLIFGSGQPLITGGQLKALSLYFPGGAEQEKIADCLSSLDELITTQNKKIAAHKTHKRGLMQQLFPSGERN